MTVTKQKTAKAVDQPGARGWWERLKLFVLILVTRFKEDQNFQQAAALAYNTLFSLLPTLVLALLVMSVVLGPPGRASRRASATSPAAAIQAASSSQPATQGGGDLLDGNNGWGEKVSRWVLNQLGLQQISIPVVRNGVTETLDLSTLISHRIERVQELVQSPGTGLIAFSVLLYGVVSLLLVIERTFNSIYRAPKNRTWVRRFSLYTCLFFWGPIGVAGSIVLTQYMNGLAEAMPLVVDWFIRPLAFLAGFIVSWTMLVILYRLIPETYVRWRSAALGALVGAALWEIGKLLFGVYLRFSVGTRNWYGSIALAPLFMLWIYLTWNFVLLGLQVSYIQQYFEPLVRRMRYARRVSVPMADMRWVLPMGVLLYRKFKSGEAMRAEEAAETLGMPPDVAGQLIKGLQQAGLVHGVEDTEGYALSRPPEEITAGQLLEAARNLCQVAADERCGDRAQRAMPLPGMRELAAMEEQWSANRTLASLATE